MTTFRKGDIVNVRAKVRYGGDIAGSGYVSLDLGYNGTTVSVDLVELALPHFDLGDVVTTGTGYRVGTVRGVASEQVWVEHDDGQFATYKATDLRLAVDPLDPVPVDPALIKTPLPAPYVASVEELGRALAEAHVGAPT